MVPRKFYIRLAQGTIKYDVAILVMETPVNFTDPRLGHIRPLCLPDSDDLTLDLPAERTGTAVGWGLDIVFYKETRCDFVIGESDSSKLPTKLKKIELQ